jgi:hypothetical protein
MFMLLCALFFASYGDSAKLDSYVPSLAEAGKPGFRKAEKCSENALRSVSQLHVGDEKKTGSNKFDMVRSIYLLHYSICILLPNALISLVPCDRKK